MNECDCFIGFLNGDEIYKSTIIGKVYEMIETQKIYGDLVISSDEALTPKKIVDSRKGHISKFVYCPFCGEKINWKKILKEL